MESAVPIDKYSNQVVWASTTVRVERITRSMAMRTGLSLVRIVRTLWEIGMASGLTISKESGGVKVELDKTAFAQWLEVDSNGTETSSPDENFRSLVDEWPAIYGNRSANALLTISSRSETLNLSLSLKGPKLNGNTLVFNDAVTSRCNSTGTPVQQAVNRINYYFNLLQFFDAKLTLVEAGYGTTASNGCTIEKGNPFIQASLIYNPIWWIQLKSATSACGAVNFQAVPPLSLVPDQNWACLCPQPGQDGECPAADDFPSE